jgi:thioredoxin 1
MQQPVATSPVITVTDDTFAELVLGSALPVVVDVWATWCPPCTAISTRLAELAEEFAGQVAVAMINSDDNPRTSRDYAVLSVPTVLVFRAGEVVARQVGARPKSQLRELFAAHC